jgi:hypothetical protein
MPIWFMVVGLLLMPTAGCSGGSGPDGEPDGKKAETAVDADKAVAGSFVGKVSGTDAFVAVVAAPAEDGKDSGAVQVYLFDGKGLSEWFSGPISEGSFSAKSDDGDAETEGELTVDSVTGTVELPGDKTARYQATPPAGAAGLYQLTVSSGGRLSGASAAGLGVTGQLSRGRQRTGVLRLIDGKRLEFSLTRTRAGDLTRLRAGQVRLIILSDGELRGVAKTRPSKGGGLEYFIRSA